MSIMSSSQKIFLSIGLGALVGAAWAGFFFYDIGYERAVRDVRGRLEGVGIINKVAEAPLSVSGTVTAVDGNTLTLSVLPPFDPTMGDRAAETYTVTLVPGTKLIARTVNTVLPKPGKTFEPIVETTIKLSDIKVGDAVVANAGQPINETSFTAITVILIN